MKNRKLNKSNNKYEIKKSLVERKKQLIQNFDKIPLDILFKDIYS